MPSSRPFAYNPTRNPIDGVSQVGDLAVGRPTAGYASTGLQWWGGPDEDLGYVICHAMPSNNQPAPGGTSASVGFNRTGVFTDAAFINLADYVGRGFAGGVEPFDKAILADDWLTTNGFWNSYSFFNAGLIMKLDSTDPVSYPGSGSTWYDLSRGGNNGTVVNATYDPLSLGFRFNGTSAYVSVGRFIPNNSSYSISAWVKATSVTGSRNIFSSQNTPFWVSNGTLYAGVGGNYTIVSSPGFPTDTWKFVSVVFDTVQGTMKLFINGEVISQASGISQFYTSENSYIGSHFSGGVNVSFWSGIISQVFVYSNVQPPINIQNIFNSTRTIYGV